jgi:membrane dipeptidase
MPFIIDAHEDLAYNMLGRGRDYTVSALETRRREAGLDPSQQRDCLLGWSEYQEGRVALVFSTLFGDPDPNDRYAIPGLAYTNPEQAHRVYWKQIEAYHRLTDNAPDQFRLVHHKGHLRSLLNEWKKPVTPPEDPEDRRPVGHPVGLVVLMEGADGIRTPDELPEWWEAGLRVIGLAWMATRYSGGTNQPGPLTSAGKDLLDAMADVGFALDLSHMDPQAALQAAERYPGTVIVSHANPKAMLRGSDSNRHLTDPLIDRIVERDGVIGMMPINGALRYGWTVPDGKAAVPLSRCADVIDYICQRAGDARHVGIGSDYDGGFGRESTPAEIDTIADLQKLAGILAERGYAPADVEAIFNGNWLRKLDQFLPAA